MNQSFKNSNQQQYLFIKLKEMYQLSSSSQSDTQPLILTLFHFNDNYNIQAKPSKNGGVCNFKAELEAQRAKYSSQQTLTLFSGDAFSPSLLSQAFKGKKMVHALNSLGIDCACFGNHQFDLRPQQTVKRAKQCNFDWLLGNIKWKQSGVLLGQGQACKVIEKSGIRIGMYGVAGSDWLGILTEDYKDQLQYTDFVEFSKKIVVHLRQQQKCDMVIALTHMRNSDDEQLAKQVPGIDLILGGHQHVICFKLINKIPVIKSGCDFNNFTIVNVTKKHAHSSAKYRGRRYHFDFELITVPFHQKIDKDLEKFVDEAMQEVEKYDEIIGYTEVPLETRFKKIRAKETNYGNFIADLARLYYNADACIINSGSIRNDRVIPKGPIKFSVLKQVFNDILVVKKIPGHIIMKVLQRSCSALPQSFSGSFLLVSGIKYTFDCSKPIGQRVTAAVINKKPIQMDKEYSVVMKYYISKGGDGYDLLREYPYSVKIPECIQTLQLIQRFFRASDIKKQETQMYINSILSLALEKAKTVDPVDAPSKMKLAKETLKNSKDTQDILSSLFAPKQQVNKTTESNQEDPADLLQFIPSLIRKKTSASDQYERINQLRTRVYINEQGEKFVCIAPQNDGRIKYLNNIQSDDEQQDNHKAIQENSKDQNCNK